MVSWRDQPTRYDIEALQANIARVGLVIRVRWVLIIVLVVYSMLGGLAYSSQMDLTELASLMWIPALALGFVVLYNTFYALNYRRLGNIAVWNNLQLLLDAFVVTVLVYFSGGANSWFWSMYSLFILEAAFILPRSRDVWLQALACVSLLGIVVWSEFLGVLPHQMIPYAESSLHDDLVFVSVRYLWQVSVLLGTAGVASLLVGEYRRQINTQGAQSILDSATGLFSRSYFMRALPAELRRAERDGCSVHVIVLDIDNFGGFNNQFGIDAGDRLLERIAQAVSKAVSPTPDIATSNVVARIGGEEFAVLFAEDTETGAHASATDALVIAERVRAVVEAVRLDGAGVTVSVGFASWPSDGATAEALLDAADAALACAAEAGGNQVFRAEDCAPTTEDDTLAPEGQ